MRVGGGRQEVGGGRWEVGGGRQEVGGGRWVVRRVGRRRLDNVKGERWRIGVWGWEVRWVMW